MTVLCKVATQLSKHNNFIFARHLISRQTLCRNIGTTKPPKTAFKLSMIGASVGALVGTGYSLHQLNKPKLPHLNEQKVIPVLYDVPKIQPSKSIKIAGDTSGLKITLYQYQTCPFCCKVRAFLDYYGISYDIVEVDPVLRQATKWSPYKRVPIVLAKLEKGHQPLNDSTMIISALSSYLLDNQVLSEVVKYYPSFNYIDEHGHEKTEIMNRYFLMFNHNVVDERRKEILNEERRWRKWADDILVHDLSPNVYRTSEEALQAFKWFSDVGEWEKHFPSWERNLIVYVGAAAMWIIGKRLKTRHHLKDDVRESLYDHCNDWIRAVNRKGGKFMGGNNPNLADLAVYGVLSSIEGCVAFQDLLNNTTIGQWFYGVKDAVVNHKGQTA